MVNCNVSYIVPWKATGWCTCICWKCTFPANFPAKSLFGKDLWSVGLNVSACPIVIKRLYVMNRSWVKWTDECMCSIWGVYMYLVCNPDGIVIVRRYYVTCLNLFFSNSRVQIYILQGKVVGPAHWCPDCSAGGRCRARRRCPSSKTLGTIARRQWGHGQNARRHVVGVKEHDIYREGPAGVVSWCQAAERSRRIFEET